MYRNLIQKIAPAHNPRHVEAYMRAERGTLDHLSATEFAAEAVAAAACIIADGTEMAERLAISYGL